MAGRVSSPAGWALCSFHQNAFPEVIVTPIPYRLALALSAALLLASISSMAGAEARSAPAHPGSDLASGDGLRAQGIHGGCSATPPPGTDAYFAGIDVSHWNGTIDWSAVQTAGVSFVMAKATQGLGFNDPMYATNKAGAEAAGLRFTAYEYMDPSGGRLVALKDASHFVKVAALGDRNLIPVLDVERTNGFSPKRLQTWMKAWLHRVYALLGVRATIYVSPSFFTSALSDTTWFAQNGYRLWIANWGVASPTVPANDWNSEGWTFWQWTDCGKVDGISGNVDLDFYAGKHFRPVRIKAAKAAGG